MKRKDDWEYRLHAILQEKKHQPFEWGVNDCALFASDIMEALSGVDPARWFRGKYSTARGAYKALKRSPYCHDRVGFNSVFESVVAELAKQHGMGEIEPDYLHRGDLALVEQDGLRMMGIHVGDGVACASKEDGIVKVARPDSGSCWRMPY